MRVGKSNGIDSYCEEGYLIFNHCARFYKKQKGKSLRVDEKMKYLHSEWVKCKREQSLRAITRDASLFASTDMCVCVHVYCLFLLT